ncbi:CRISPR-associated endonuclease Cas3'' [Candidatus Poriferisodalis sp.]|uniref:CRISPR-associated endonuclease Cas3'' n=1 Tax=Candidatus Poriferisodalis sp. TaxID=3101277 RepID=UPI003D12805C
MTRTRPVGLSLWGKSHSLDEPYPLVCHLLDTAAAAEAITAQMLPRSMIEAIARHLGASPDEWVQVARVLAGWHDIGKASCGFQNFDKVACPAWARGHRDSSSAGKHDRIGALLTWDRLDSIPVRARARVAQIIGGHHGLVPLLNAQELSAWGGAAQTDQSPPPELDHARRWLWATLDSVLGEMPSHLIATPAASMTLAVVVLADWIASSHDLINEHQNALDAEGFDPAGHYKRALALSGDHLRATGLVAPGMWKRPVPADLIHRGEPSWTDLQSSVSDAFRPTGPGIVVICAPTGEGKTEAALLAASKLAVASERYGMFFAMPTVATAEGLYSRLERCMERLIPAGESPALRRVHSQALLTEGDAHVAVSDESAATRAAAAWMQGTRKSLLAPFGVGTIDQVLLGALRSKHSPLRILGAATGVLVIDEAHSLDPYMRKLLCRALEWLAALATPVVVLSATMPHKRVEELCVAYQAGCGAERDTEFALDGYPSWLASIALGDCPFSVSKQQLKRTGGNHLRQPPGMIVVIVPTLTRRRTA